MTANLSPTLKFLKRTIIHKAFVFRAGLRTRAPFWRLVFHDWTKFLPSEAPHYGRQLFGSADDPISFSQAWNHHHKSNPHHWEWWIPLTTHGRASETSLDPLPMADWAVREMVADWLGASRVNDGFWQQKLSEWAWFHSARPMMRLHPDTSARVDVVLAQYFQNPIS